jgi:hypothetical protein
MQQRVPRFDWSIARSVDRSQQWQVKNTLTRSRSRHHGAGLVLCWDGPHDDIPRLSCNEHFNIMVSRSPAVEVRPSVAGGYYYLPDHWGPLVWAQHHHHHPRHDQQRRYPDELTSGLPSPFRADWGGISRGIISTSPPKLVFYKSYITTQGASGELTPDNCSRQAVRTRILTFLWRPVSVLSLSPREVKPKESAWRRVTTVAVRVNTHNQRETGNKNHPTTVYSTPTRDQNWTCFPGNVVWPR